METDIIGVIFFTLPIDLPVLGQQNQQTMIVSWIVMLLITGLCIWLTHDLKEENISKRQAVAELLVEQANKFVIGNMGEKFRYMIPFVAALFATSAAFVSNPIKPASCRDFIHIEICLRKQRAVVVFIMITARVQKTSRPAVLAAT